MSTTAKISWVEGALFVAEAGSGHTITMDGAPDVGGEQRSLFGEGGAVAVEIEHSATLAFGGRAVRRRSATLVDE